MASPQSEIQQSSTPGTGDLEYTYVEMFFVHWFEDDLGVWREEMELRDALRKFSDQSDEDAFPRGARAGSLHTLEEWLQGSRKYAEGKKKALFVFCYCGHGSVDETGQFVLSPYS